jgi:hypothetical protein
MKTSIVPIIGVFRTRAESDFESHIASFAFFSEAWWWAIERRMVVPEDKWSFECGGRRFHLPELVNMDVFEKALRFLAPERVA